MVLRAINNIGFSALVLLGRKLLQIACFGSVVLLLIYLVNQERDFLVPTWFEKVRTRPTIAPNFGSRFCLWKSTLWWYKKKKLVCNECLGSNCDRISIVRNHCGKHPFHVKWDARIQSLFTESSRHWILSSDGHTYKQHPDCSVRTCWALERCAMNAPMTMFIPQDLFPLLRDQLLEYSIQRKLIQVVHDNPEAACIVLLTTGIHSSLQDFLETLRDGQNRLVWDASQIRFPLDPHVRLSGDDAFTSFHVGKSIVASVGLTASQLRLHYDFSLPLPRKWGPRQADRSMQQHNRTYVIAFRGQWTNRKRPYYLHRWLAYAYWDSSPDIYVDLMCIRYSLGGLWKTIVKHYDAVELSYDELVLNATFGFAPGGSGPGSFRFGEILSAGGIPVVVPDTILPFWPALDWSSCVVQISESELVNLPRLLRNFTLEAIAKRQEACWKKMKLAFGDFLDPDTQRYVSDPKQVFATTMHILWTRIQQAKIMSALS